MNVKGDASKQAQEVILSRKLQKTNHNRAYYNHDSVQQILFQKHLGMYIDTELNFEQHLNDVLSKVINTIGLLHKL